MPASPVSTPVVIAVDAGTTGVRAVAFGADGAPVASSYREFAQYFPQPGWVEHDAGEIWEAVRSTLAATAAALPDGTAVATIGITNQRETLVAWDRRTGALLHRAVVWQDRRTAARCAALDDEGALAEVRAWTGLVLDPYFSATKAEWLLREGLVAPSAGLAFGTVDSWVLWNLTGGRDGGVFATEPSNASRTMLYDIGRRQWSPELTALFGVPPSTLPEVRASAGRFGTVAADACAALAGVPVDGILGDQQAALLGQACTRPGMAKATYGTGSFVLLNVGARCPEPAEGLLTTVAWDLGRHAGGGAAAFSYALEGAVFATGAAIQWLRDGLRIIDAAEDVGPLAAQVPDSQGVFVVPAFTGLGSPWWDPYARGTIVGITRGVGRAHLARAVIEAIAFQVRDVAEAMAAASGTPLAELRADGGASVLDLLLQLQADQVGVPVVRPAVAESTALGAAFAAGLAAGVWDGVGALDAVWTEERRFTPAARRAGADAAHAGWKRAVERARRWAAPSPPA